MTPFLFVLAALAIGFGLGHWVTLHPAETRSFGQQLADAGRRLFKKKQPEEPPKP